MEADSVVLQSKMHIFSNTLELFLPMFKIKKNIYMKLYIIRMV